MDGSLSNIKWVISMLELNGVLTAVTEVTWSLLQQREFGHLRIRNSTLSSVLETHWKAFFGLIICARSWHTFGHFRPVWNESHMCWTNSEQDINLAETQLLGQCVCADSAVSLKLYLEWVISSGELHLGFYGANPFAWEAFHASGDQKCHYYN